MGSLDVFAPINAYMIGSECIQSNENDVFVYLFISMAMGAPKYK